MRNTRSVTVVHSDTKVRILLRSILEAHGCSVSTDHSCSDLMSGGGDIRPDIILVDRSLLPHEGIDVLSHLSRKWDEAEIVFLPEGLSGDVASTAVAPQLLGIVDRMLKMRPTREILGV